MFTVDPGTDVSTSILSGVGVWGATADLANSRVLFTRASGLTPPDGTIGGGDELFAIAFDGDTPTSLGRITNAAGDGQRIDGLAITGGELYGVNAGAAADNGLFVINMGTLQASQIATWTDSISGIDADPASGVIYGVDDSIGQLVTVGLDGTIAIVAAYPAGISDIDGLAVGGGFAYLITDESGAIPVYDLGAGDYTISLTSPFGAADTFSGGAFAGGDGGGDGGGGGVPATGTWGVITLIALFMVVSLFFLRRRVKA